MRKKKQPVHASFVQPIMMSMLLAVAVPLVSLASARTNADTGASTPVYEQYTPRTDQSGLVDKAALRRAHRERYAPETNQAPSSSASSDAAASADSPCITMPKQQSQSSSLSPTMFRYDDLTDTQKAELRKQLRIGGCPYDVLPGYMELCELMLKQRREIQGHPAATRLPLKNPYQEQFSENID